MKSSPYPTQIRLVLVLFLIGTVLLCVGVIAETDRSALDQEAQGTLTGNGSLVIGDVQQTTTVVPETSTPVQETTEPTPPETVTESPMTTPEEETTGPTPAETVTEIPTTTPEEETTGSTPTETVTESPKTAETTTIPTTISSNATPISTEAVVSVIPEPKKYAGDEVIVRYNYKKIANKNLLTAESVKTNAEIGSVVRQDFSNEGLAGMQLVKIPDNMSVDDAISWYENNPDVLYAEPNYILSIASTVPSDPYYAGYQWGLNNNGQTIEGYPGTADADIDAPEAWDLSTGSVSIVVAIIDTGVDYNHPDLSANIWTNSGEIAGNGIDDDHNGYPDDVHGWDFDGNTSDPIDVNSGDDVYHGTHCAGIVGAVGNNAVGITGVNWNVKIMPLRFLNETGKGYTSNAISAIRYANANGADVISNSWGGTTFTQALKDAIDESSAVVVCAAGNSGTNNDVAHFYPSDFTSSNIISVAATDNTDQLADFSNYGATSVDLAAPGVDIYSTKLGPGYQYLSGTSMATPFVAGVAALVKAENLSLTTAQLKSAILNNVDTKSSLSGKVATGGRLNAYEAVLAATLGADMIGVYDDGWYILDYNGDGAYLPASDKVYTIGSTGYTPVVGDWNGDGTTEIGAFYDGLFVLDNNGDGSYTTGTDKQFTLGGTGYTPLVGDWNGDGNSSAGVFKDGWFILDYDGDGTYAPGSDKVYSLGGSGYTGIVGDWNGNHKTKIGVFKNGIWILDYDGDGTYAPGTDKVYAFGDTGWIVQLGDWNGNHKTKIGVYKDAWYILDFNGDGAFTPGTDKVYALGDSTWTSVLGDWNGEGTTKIGVFQNGWWILDYDGDGGFTPGTDKVYALGGAGWAPAIGKWS